MAEEVKEKKLEREYVIPLRRSTLKVPRYKRTSKAITTIKQFIARHMKVPDRDLSKVKLDVYFNNNLWFRGKKKPPAKVKVRATKEGEIVKVDFVETPQIIKFLKARHEKIHKKVEKKPSILKPAKEEKTPEEKKDEEEKGKATEIQNIQQAEKDLKAEKHTIKSKEPVIQRKALKK